MQRSQPATEAATDAAGRDRVAVVVATRGRAQMVARLVARLRAQSRRPEVIVVCARDAADVVGAEGGDVATLFAGGGLTAQRNRGLAHVEGGVSHIVFFDDDFVPSRFWIERMLAACALRPGLASLPGEVLRDGILTAGLSWDEAERDVDARDREPPPPIAFRDGTLPYGCNMAFRMAAITGMRFDERLVLYAWQEDADFGARVARRGGAAWTDAMWGVHLGAKTGRVAGVPLGYSQIVNPLYLARKGSLTASHSMRMIARNVAANAVKSLRPEPYVDRRGRLRGNLIAVGDVARGRARPERVLEL